VLHQTFALDETMIVFAVVETMIAFVIDEMILLLDVDGNSTVAYTISIIGRNACHYKHNRDSMRRRALSNYRRILLCINLVFCISSNIFYTSVASNEFRTPAKTNSTIW